MKNEIFRGDMSETNVPVINLEKCTGCGLCAEICLTYDVINGKGNRARPIMCIKCGACGAFCPSGAIEGSCAEEKRLRKKDIDKLPSPGSLQFLFKSRRSVRRYGGARAGARGGHGRRSRWRSPTVSVRPVAPARREALAFRFGRNAGPLRGG